jgi:cytidylate kinase
MGKIIIAIDGYSACGKSTLARQLASKLNYLYLDTGAMYRAVALHFLENGIDWRRREFAELELDRISLHFERDPTTGMDDVYLDDRNVEADIRTMAVSDRVTEVAAMPWIRRALVIQQRAVGKDKGVVMDGRDIGTIVFPGAELKLFVTARLDIRIERRLEELRERGLRIARAEVARNLSKRDHEETTREDSPLKRASDAVIFDTSDMSPDQMLAKSYALAVGAIERAG